MELSRRKPGLARPRNGWQLMSMLYSRDMPEDKQYPVEEARRRFEAALRGARLAEHIQMPRKTDPSHKKANKKARGASERSGDK
jgi:hypothetical protein